MVEPEPEGEGDVLEPSIMTKKRSKSKNRRLRTKRQREAKKLLKMKKSAQPSEDSKERIREGLNHIFATSERRKAEPDECPPYTC